MKSRMSADAEKPSGSCVRKRKIRQPHRPVRKLKAQAVPALAAPALGDATALQHEMRQAALLQAMTHGEPGLAAADDQGLDAFNRHRRRTLLTAVFVLTRLLARSGATSLENAMARGGADDPAPERGEVALLGPEGAIDQVPAHALRHAERERRHQPPGGEVVVDIGPDAHRDARARRRRPAAPGRKLKLRSARGDARDAGGLQPQRPVVRTNARRAAGSAPSDRRGV